MFNRWGLGAAVCLILISSLTEAEEAPSQLAARLSDTYGIAVAATFPASEREEVAACIGKAMASGIPEPDQEVIAKAIETKQLTARSKSAIEKWLGGAAIHGALRKPDFDDPSTFKEGTLSYADGTAQLATDADVERRLNANMRQLCPSYSDRILGTAQAAPAKPAAPVGSPKSDDASQFQDDASECEKFADGVGGTLEEKRGTYRNCMKNRGYSVLN